MKNMSLQIKPGEVHGLVGENGAGKSTLIKVLTGVHMPDKGEIWVDGVQKKFTKPSDARDAGIACVYQELNIVKLLSITDNIFIGRGIKNKLGLLNYEAMHKEAQNAMCALGHDIDPRRICGNLGMGLQQMIEIGKAIQLNSKLIIMDEPTSLLGEKEVFQLMSTVRKLKEQGVAILFVSHKLEELFEICDRVTVMRDGEHICTKKVSDMTNESLITAMVGRTLDDRFPKEFGVKGECMIRVENLNAGILRNVSFEAYGGQILGFAGLVGAGRTETMRAIFGADPIESGAIYIKGKKANINSPAQAVAQGIAFLTEDRKGQGLILSQAVSINLILASIKKFSKFGMLNNNAIHESSNRSIHSLRIRTPSNNEIAGQLSGGNQQKVVIGKWINTDADIYIFDEPTRGIDVGAKIEVYNIMNSLVKKGKCVIMISSELPEILGMSDRVIVMREGRVMAEIDRGSEHFNQESIMKAGWGGVLV